MKQNITIVKKLLIPFLHMCERNHYKWSEVSLF